MNPVADTAEYQGGTKHFWLAGSKSSSQVLTNVFKIPDLCLGDRLRIEAFREKDCSDSFLFGLIEFNETRGFNEDFGPTFKLT